MVLELTLLVAAVVADSAGEGLLARVSPEVDLIVRPTCTRVPAVRPRATV